MWQEQDILYLVPQIFRNWGVKVQDTTKQIVPEEETIAKYTIKDSVFSDLFKIKKYQNPNYM